MVPTTGLEPENVVSRTFANIHFKAVNTGVYSLLLFWRHERIYAQNESPLSGFVRSFLACRIRLRHQNTNNLLLVIIVGKDVGVNPTTMKAAHTTALTSFAVM
jgi:hypothetical protein